MITPLSDPSLVDIAAISADLYLDSDGIWFAREVQPVSYPAQGSDQCFLIEDHSFWFQHRNQCIITAVQSYPPLAHGAIVDLGGGNGFGAKGLMQSGFNVVLLEPNPRAVRHAKTRGLTHIICATLETAHIRPASLSAVGLFDVLEHVAAEVAYLQQLYALLRPKAYLYVTVPAYSWLWSDEDNQAGHFRRYTLTQLSQAITAAGFAVCFQSYIFRFLPFPALILRALPYRLGWRLPATSATIARDHATHAGGRLTQILSKLLQPEISYLQQQQPMLFGGSCLLIAQKPES